LLTAFNFHNIILLVLTTEHTNKTKKGNTMKNAIFAAALVITANIAIAATPASAIPPGDVSAQATASGIPPGDVSAHVAASGIPPIDVSAHAEANVQASAIPPIDVSAHAEAAPMQVSAIPPSDVSSPKPFVPEAGSEVATAAMGFGLLGLIGGMKVMGRRRKQK
jgi:hypothetical protein